MKHSGLSARPVVYFSACLFVNLFTFLPCFSQDGDTILVREKYFGTPLLKVLHDFETKYGMKLKYDSTLVADYRYDYLYTGTPRQLAFDIIFRETDGLSSYVDEDGIHCIVRTEMPKNRTCLENKRYEGNAARRNLTVSGRIKDQTNGEKDLFRTFQLMPGISGSNESSAGMYVRGGTPDQNLVLYDGFTIYHQEHLMGVFSAFNTNALKDVQLHKGGFDAKYGGRLSSVMEIVGKTGNDKEFNLGGDAGFLGFNAFMEIPFKNEKGSIFLAERRSFPSFMYDKFTNVYSNSDSQGTIGGGGPGDGFNQRNQEKPESYFYDLNAKLTYNPTKKDIISLSFFNGEDDLDNSREGFGSSFMSGSITDKTDWGNVGSSLKWSRNWDDRFYSNLLLSFSNYYSSRDRQNNAAQSNSTTTANAIAVMFDQNTAENNHLWDYSVKFDNELKINRNNTSFYTPTSETTLQKTCFLRS
jgi:hypothetical protein